MADILASLAITLVMGAEEKITILVCSRSVVLPGDEDSEEDANITYVLKTDEENWCPPIIEYLEHEKISSHPNHKIKIQWRAPRFLYYNETLYRCFFFFFAFGYDDWMWEKQCKQWRRLIGVCGAHQSGPCFIIALKRMGILLAYHGAKLHRWCKTTKRCDAC